MKMCPKCKTCNLNTAVICENCGSSMTHVKIGNYSSNRLSNKIILTTAPYIDGFRVIETLDIITSECVFGMNIIRDMFAAISDIFGGRSQASQKVLRDARVTCLRELRREATEMGANAVIAVDLDYSEFSGGGKSMLFLVASGTAVKIEEITTDDNITNQVGSDEVM